MNKSYDESLKENRYWVNTLNTKYFYSEDNHTKYLETVNSITAEDIKKFASNLLEKGDLKKVVMLPVVEE
jgi:zinc protease